MSNMTFAMTAGETAIYDADGPAAVEQMRALEARAQALANKYGNVVEVLTADGVVAAVREPDGEAELTLELNARAAARAADGE